MSSGPKDLAVGQSSPPAWVGGLETLLRCCAHFICKTVICALTVKTSVCLLLVTDMLWCFSPATGQYNRLLALFAALVSQQTSGIHLREEPMGSRAPLLPLGLGQDKSIALSIALCSACVDCVLDTNTFCFVGSPKAGKCLMFAHHPPCEWWNGMKPRWWLLSRRVHVSF